MTNAVLRGLLKFGDDVSPDDKGKAKVVIKITDSKGQVIQVDLQTVALSADKSTVVLGGTVKE